MPMIVHFCGIFVCGMALNFNFVVGCPTIAIVRFMLNAAQCCDINLSQMLHQFMLPCAHEFDSFACDTDNLPTFVMSL